MKIHIILCALLHFVYSYNVYNNNNGANIYDQHVPVIKDGVPIDTPEVQAAKAQHYQAVAKAGALAAKSSKKPIYEAPEEQRYYKPAPTFWISSNSIPQDTPEVAAAKASHLAALQQAHSLGVHDNDDGQYRPNGYYQRSSRIQNVANQYVNRFNNVGPVDTPEVQQAKQAHLAAFTQANKRYKRDFSLYEQHVPVITKDGVPEDTLEVQQARNEHLLAHAKAKQQNFWKDYAPIEDNNVNYIVQHGDDGQQYHGPQHVPILDKNGVPIDTPEVQEARRQHLLEHVKATSGYNYETTGPEDTIEVQLAKADHFAAHAKAHQDGSYGFSTIAGYLGDSKHDTTVYDYGHNQVTKTSSHIKHEHYPSHYY